MADRVAVFNEGRVVQVGSPPRTSTTGRARASWPISSARPTCCRPADGGRAGRPAGRLRPEAVRPGRAGAGRLAGAVSGGATSGRGPSHRRDEGGRSRRLPRRRPLPAPRGAVGLDWSGEALHVMEDDGAVTAAEPARLPPAAPQGPGRGLGDRLSTCSGGGPASFWCC
jgi:hypothetical protein